MITSLLQVKFKIANHKIKHIDKSKDYASYINLLNINYIVDPNVKTVFYSI